MKIIETRHKRKCPYIDGHLYDYGIEIAIETESDGDVIRFFEGEPEDFTMGRDLNDAYSISDMLIIAYEAGKRGEAFCREFRDEILEED